MNLVIVTYLWGPKYSAADVQALAESLVKNLRVPYRFVCVVDQEYPELNVEQIKLVSEKDYGDCSRRLKLFDPAVTDYFDADYILSLDLDVVIRKDITSIVRRAMAEADTGKIVTAEGFAPISEANVSFCMFKRGYHVDVWDLLNEEDYRKATARTNISDEAWINYLKKSSIKVLDSSTGMVMFALELQRKIKNSDPHMIFFAGAHKASSPLALKYLQQFKN